MKKIIRLTEEDIRRCVKRVLRENKDNPSPGQNRISGTNTASAGAYVTPGGISWNTDDRPPQRKQGGYRDPYYPDDPYDRKRPPKKQTDSYETKLRSTQCCRKCKNGRYKHNCDDVQKGGINKYSSTNCVYATLSDCQLNKRSKPGNIKGVKSKK